MLKKTLSVIISALMLLFLFLPAAALEDTGVISVKLNSNIAGKTCDDLDSFIEVKNGHVVRRAIYGSPVTASDYAGTPYNDAFVAGRTYYIDYCLSADEGYELPDKIPDDLLQIECGENITVYSKQITESHTRNENGSFDIEKNLRIQARVVVDGNAFQRIVGWFHDLILKIKAWSLY